MPTHTRDWRFSVQPGDGGFLWSVYDSANRAAEIAQTKIQWREKEANRG